MLSNPLKIAVIGGGVAGIVAAYLLDREHEVTLIEAADYVGGHTHTITLPTGPDVGTPIDTGFVVLNDRTYPFFQKFLQQLNVAIRPSTMSFSFYCRQTGFCYASRVPNGLFAQRQNLFRPTFWQMIGDIVRFNKETVTELHQGQLNGQTLGDYVRSKGYSQIYIDQHLVPAAAAIWSSPPDSILNFPVKPFIKFYEHHGLLSLTRRPQWYTVVGGSQAYVHAFLEQFQGQVWLNSPVECVRRLADGVHVHLKDGRTRNFDKVIIATHANQALRLLDDPSPQEKRLLGAWTYHKNHTLLHTDTKVLSPNQRVWSSWNYVRGEEQKGHTPISVTYHMNHLQGLTTQQQYLVSLNDTQAIADKDVIAEMTYTHPCYTFESLASQSELPTLNGQRHTWFCGSYFGYGFHEDAVRSGVAVGEQFGLAL